MQSYMFDISDIRISQDEVVAFCILQLHSNGVCVQTFKPVFVKLLFDPANEIPTIRPV